MRLRPTVVALCLALGPTAAFAASMPAAVAADAKPTSTAKKTTAKKKPTGAKVQVDPSVKAPPAISARGWILADVDTGEILAAGNPDGQYAPASTIKTLTALALMPELNLEDKHVAIHAEAGAEGSKAGIVEGGEYTINDLLHGMLLSSGNDTAAALANAVGGLPTATKLMNDAAKAAGATNTVAKNTSGLDAEGQVTTAHDLACIARAALKNEDLAKFFTTRTYKFPGKMPEPGEERKTFQISNHNKLLYNMDGATGVKTGYTIASRHTYIGSGEREGRHLVAAMLRSEVRPWQQAKQLIEWGFEVGDDIKPVGKLNAPEPPKPTEEPTPEPTESTDNNDSEAAKADEPAADPAQASSDSDPVRTYIGIGMMILSVGGLAGVVLYFRAQTKHM